MIFLELCRAYITFNIYVDKKGRGSSSILISTMGQARMHSKRRKVNEEEDAQIPMNVPMNAPMAGDGPNQMQDDNQNPEHSQS